MKQYIYIFSVISLSILLISCNLEEVSPDEYDQDTFWYSAKTAEAGLTGCYSVLLNAGLYGGATAIWEETASPNAYNYHNSNGWNSIALGTQTADIGIFEARWRAAYTGIGRCNLLINNIGQSRELSSAQIEQMKAQARFLRVLYYHILTIYYDKVPFSTNIASLADWNLPRTNRKIIVEFLIQELDEISRILPRTENSAKDKGRPTAGAALALKTKILLFEASPLFNSSNDKTKWQAVSDAAEKVITTGGYDLFPNYRTLFSLQNKNSVECIFDVQCVNISNYGTSFDIVLRQYNTCAPLQGLVDAYWMRDGKPRNESVFISSTDYKDMDPRFYHTVVYPGSTFMGQVVKTDGSNSMFTNVQTGYTFKKYSIYDSHTPTSEEAQMGENRSPINYMILRYADILLMYAEAKNELGELTENVWNKTIRPIRARGGFTMGSALDYPGNDYNLLLEHIRYERRIEFAGEGYYYNDLRRWMIAENELPETIRKFDGTPIITRTFNRNRDYLWSVPSSQIELAPTLLPNNPGW